MPGSVRLQLLTGSEAVQEQEQGALLLDIRRAERFAAFHLSGAVQIGLPGRFASWAAFLIKPSQRIVLIGETVSEIQEGYVRLARVGLGLVIGNVLADEAQWRNDGLKLGSISVEHCANVSGTLQENPSVQLVDVRSRAEWLQGHLPGALSIPLLELEAALPLIDPSKRSLVYCHEGFRATTAASILLKESPGDIGILIDGIEGWSALGLPLEVPRPK